MEDFVEILGFTVFPDDSYIVTSMEYRNEHVLDLIHKTKTQIAESITTAAELQDCLDAVEFFFRAIHLAALKNPYVYNMGLLLVLDPVADAAQISTIDAEQAASEVSYPPLSSLDENNLIDTQLFPLLDYSTDPDYEALLNKVPLSIVTYTVTTIAGFVYDSNDVSQTSMSNAILSLGAGETIDWKMNDNSIQNITKEELQEAFGLAIAQKTAILQDLIPTEMATRKQDLADRFDAAVQSS